MPGVFIRCPSPSSSKSCIGTIAMQATDAMALRTSGQGMASDGKPRYSFTRWRSSSPRALNHETVVSLSWVPASEDYAPGLCWPMPAKKCWFLKKQNIWVAGISVSGVLVGGSWVPDREHEIAEPAVSPMISIHGISHLFFMTASPSRTFLSASLPT